MLADSESDARSWFVPLALPALVVGCLVLPSTPAVAQMPTTPKGLYDIGCANCHGLDGAGVDRSRVAFDIPLPDFSDCSFAEREPDADWIAVAHQGGPVRGFDRTMPAYGEAFSQAQLQLIMDHIRVFCADKRWPRGELNLPRALVTEKAFPEDEAVWTVTANVEGKAKFVNEVLYEKRFGPRSMFEIVVPFGAADVEDPGGGWNAAVGDVGIGLKHTLMHDVDAGHILSVGGEVILPTGSADNGFSKDVTIFEPYFAYGQILPGATFLQMQAGFELSTDQDKRDHEAFWRAVYGGSFSQGQWGRTWSPMLELLGSVDLEEAARVHWDVVPQFQVSLNTRQHVLLNIGLRVPINDTGRRTTQLIVYVLWDWFDGGLLDGW